MHSALRHLISEKGGLGAKPPAGRGPDNNKLSFHHIPVMPDEVITALNIKPNGVYVDGTAGGGGHSVEIVRRLPHGRLVCIDKDPQAVAAASERLREYPQARVAQGDFADLPDILDHMEIGGVDGVLLDLGISSHQVDVAGRGFSYHQDGPLDMRMSPEGKSAAQLLMELPEGELAGIFRKYGEERFAGRIAKKIVSERAKKHIETTLELVEIIRGSIPAAARREGGHPAKRVFQALRIAVNGELESLRICLDAAFERLNPGGRFAVISFHSLEDRMVKQAFAQYAKGCGCPPDFPVCVCAKKPRGRLIGKKPQTASGEELEQNSRSAGAKLRAIEKLQAREV